MGSSIFSTKQQNAHYERLNEQPKTSSQISNMRKVDFKLSIAVDFGTDGCALAFAYKDKVTIYNKWSAQQIDSTSRAAKTTKTKTQLILNENNEVTVFGNPAKFTYFHLSEKEQQNKKFFERFKMALYETDLTRSNNIIEVQDEKKRDDINTAEYLYDSKDDPTEAKIVFIAALRQLQIKAKDYIPEQITSENILDNEIQWIVTVPAIWSEKAKNKMRDWMIEATLIDKDIIDQCVIVYEPDCASLSMQRKYLKDITKKHRKTASINVIFNPCDDIVDVDSDQDEKHFKTAKKKAKFEKDDKYILIDAGGGTVDIACHRILENGDVEEIVYPTGDKWGSCYIDDLYIKLLEKIFSKEWMDYYKNKSPAGFVGVMTSFKMAKETFYKNHRAKTHRIYLPDEFVRFLTSQCEKQQENVVGKIDQFAKSKQLKYFRELFLETNESKSDEKNENEYDFDEQKDESVCILKLIKERMNDDNNDEDSDSEDDTVQPQWIEYIEMDTKIWQCLFDSKINPIISHVEELLKIKSLKDCKFLGLVGGFSCSKYFQYRMQKTFGEYGFYQMTIVIPKNPMLSVVEGAALMAVTKFKYMQARRLKYTYGVSVYCEKAYAKTLGITDEYINNKDNISNDGLVKNIFSIIAFKNERIPMGVIKKSMSYRRKVTTSVPILKSENMNPKLANEGEVLAILVVSYTDEQKETITEFHFYDTLFQVYSYPKSNTDAKQHAYLKYV